MEKLLQKVGLKKSQKKETDFARFFRDASSAERKKVFLRVAREATKDQRKIMGL